MDELTDAIKALNGVKCTMAADYLCVTIVSFPIHFLAMSNELVGFNSLGQHVVFELLHNHSICEEISLPKKRETLK